jgi:hypothetical protein
VFGSKGSELVARDDCDAPRREGKRPRTAWLLCRVHSGKERFLEVKIAAEEALLAKLVDLPHQDGPCPPAVSQADSTISTGVFAIGRPWAPLGATGRYSSKICEENSSLSILRAPTTQNITLISLPIKLGGLGILTFKTYAQLAFAASSEASDALLVPLLGQNTDVALSSILFQRERCQEAFLPIWDSLLDTLDLQATLNQSSKCPRCLGGSGSLSSPSPQRSGSPILTYLQLYTHRLCSLAQQRTAGTVECTDRLANDGICAQRTPWVVARHEPAKYAVRPAL